MTFVRARRALVMRLSFGISWATLSAAVLAAVVAAWGGVAVAVAQQVEGPPAAPEVDPWTRTRVAPLWERHWRRFAAKTIPFEGDFVSCPAFDRQFPSSAKVTPDQWRHDHSVRRRVGMGGALVQTQTVTPPREEGEAAAMLLPEMAVGQYGHIHSVKVLRVLGPLEMLVDDVWLVDPEQVEAERDRMERDLRQKAGNNSDARGEINDRVDAAFEQRKAAAGRQRRGAFTDQARLVGFPTQGLEPGRRYTGPAGRPFQVAVLRAEDQMSRTGRTTSTRRSSSSRARQQLVLGPALDFTTGVTEHQFRAMIEKRGLTDAQFVQMVLDAHQIAPDDPDSHVFAQLERRRAAIEAQEAEEAAKADEAKKD